MPTDNTIGDYKPLTPDERGQWNDFLSHLASQGVNKQLDGDDELGHAHMAQYGMLRPDFTLTPDHVANIQMDHDNLRNGESFSGISGNSLQALRDKFNPAFINQKIPEANGIIDSKTANLFYPTVKVVNSKGQPIDDHGTDIEKYAQNYLSAPDKATAPITEKPGAAINPTDKEAQEWLQSYIESPKYKERLSNFWKDPAYVQQTRANQLKDVKFSETSGTKLVDGQVVRNGATVYDSTDNSMNVNPDQLKELKAGRGEADVHELAHGQNAGDYKSLQLNPVEQNYMFQREIQPTTDDKKYWPQYAEKQGQSISDELAHNAATHDIAPSENMSDIQAIRYMAYKKGIYDARKDDLTPELLDKIKKDPDIKNSFTGKRVFSNFDDKGLLDIMNKIAYQGKEKDEDTA